MSHRPNLRFENARIFVDLRCFAVPS